jgi:hypothetical protein
LRVKATLFLLAPKLYCPGPGYSFSISGVFIVYPGTKTLLYASRDDCSLKVVGILVA